MAKVEEITAVSHDLEKSADAMGVSDTGSDRVELGTVAESRDGLKRTLSPRQIQMMTIGGTIGTALFVSIGYGLINGGPGSLLIGFLLYATFLGSTNSCIAEVSLVHCSAPVGPSSDNAR